MERSQESLFGQLLTRVAFLLGAFVLAVGVAVLGSWLFGIPLIRSVWPGLVPMKANTAVLCILSGAALLLIRSDAPTKWRRRTAATFAGFVLFVALLTLSQDLLGYNLRIDQLLVRDPHGPLSGAPPGRMAPFAALAFSLSSTAIFGLVRGQVVAAQLTALAAGLIGYLTLVAYAYGVDALYQISAFRSIALPTAATLVALNMGILAARPAYGPVAIFAGPGTGGIMSRRLLPFVLLFPPLLGSAVLVGLDGPSFAPAFQMAVLTAGLVVALGAVVVWTTRALSRLDSARHRANEGMRREAEFNQAIIESAVVGVATVDPGGRYMMVNPRFCEMMGYTESELVGSPVSMLIPPEDREGSRERIRRIIAGTVVMDVEREMVRKDGSRIQIMYGASPLTSNGRTLGLVATILDITERRRLEAQLRQAQRLESVGQLASGIAHDFNNLLTVIIGHAETLAGNLSAGTSGDDGARQIVEAAQRAAALTGQLLAFARKQMVQPWVMNFNHVVTRSESLLRRLIREDITLVVRPGADLGSVLADPGQIEQVLINLAINARDAIESRGTITIETANVTLDDAYARQHADVVAGEHVMLAVSDNGVGMNAEVRARLFEPFFTTKELGRGTGLGLATCYGIIKQCAGSIAVYSEPGRGATFKVYLPRVRQQAEAPLQPLPSMPTPRGSETILLAEDEPLVRGVLVAALRGQGYTVLEAVDGQDALRRLAEHEGPIDLLISDALMPNMSGRELAARVREHHGTVKVLFISGYTEEASVQNGARDPHVAFLPKPFTPRALAERVRDVLAGTTGDHGPSA